MGRAIEVVGGHVTNVSTTITAMTANTGNSFTVRNFSDPARAWLDGLWAQAATAGVIRVRSPKLHDFTQGIRFTDVAAVSRTLIPEGLSQMLYAQDNLTFEMSGGASETDAGAMLIYYEDLPGVDARLATWDQVASRILFVLTVEVSVTNPTTAGDWSAGTAINATFDLLKANTDYAILGYQAASAVGAVAVVGPDLGNLRAGGPGTTESIETRSWFKRLSQNTGRPYIPIINSANKAGTNAAVIHTTASGSTTVDLVMAQLSPGVGV